MSGAPNQQEAAEQLALVLTNHGLQRMTARVLSALLFTEQPTITAGELADQLAGKHGRDIGRGQDADVGWPGRASARAGAAAETITGSATTPGRSSTPIRTR